MQTELTRRDALKRLSQMNLVPPGRAERRVDGSLGKRLYPPDTNASRVFATRRPSHPGDEEPFCESLLAEPVVRTIAL
jgi:hypothetical protein